MFDWLKKTTSFLYPNIYWFWVAKFSLGVTIKMSNRSLGLGIFKVALLFICQGTYAALVSDATLIIYHNRIGTSSTFSKNFSVFFEPPLRRWIFIVALRFSDVNRFGTLLFTFTILSLESFPRIARDPSPDHPCKKKACCSQHARAERGCIYATYTLCASAHP